MEFWLALALFAAKALIWVVAIAVILILLFGLILKARGEKPQIEVEDLNNLYDLNADTLKFSILEEKELKQEAKKNKKKAKEEVKKNSDKKRIFVLDFVGDIRASRVESLREEITAILSVARPSMDEVVVKVESPGGMVHTYGLAASQLARVRERGIQLTISVDKVAASGGYMMACTGNKILAAPFAILGSIGVVAQVPNLHRLLRKHDVDYEEITAGEFKRTISLFGEITPKGRQKFLEQIEQTHMLFKDFVQTYRPQLQVDKVATGEYWYGKEALALGLADTLISSDDYLFQQKDSARIFKIETPIKKKLADKIAENMSLTFDRLVQKVFERGFESKLP